MGVHDRAQAVNFLETDLAPPRQPIAAHERTKVVPACVAQRSQPPSSTAKVVFETRNVPRAPNFARQGGAVPQLILRQLVLSSVFSICKAKCLAHLTSRAHGRHVTQLRHSRPAGRSWRCCGA